jgi:PAS domain-containing protein
VEGRVITGPNEHKWVHGASRPRLQENGDIIWDGVLMNITRRKEEIEAAGQRRALYCVHDNSPAIAFMKDEAGRYVYVNRPFEQRFHLAREQWFHKTDAELWPDTAAACANTITAFSLHRQPLKSKTVCRGRTAQSSTGGVTNFPSLTPPELVDCGDGY